MENLAVRKWAIYVIGLGLSVGLFVSRLRAEDFEFSPLTPDVVAAIPGSVTGDEARLVLIGQFSNGCESLGRIDQIVDTKKFLVELRISSARPRGVGCLSGMVPYSREVTLGRLPFGNYAVLVNGQAMGKIAVLKGWGPQNLPNHIVTLIEPRYSLDEAKSDGERGTLLVQGFAGCDTKVVGVKLSQFDKGFARIELETEYDEKREPCGANKAFHHEVSIPKIPRGISLIYLRGFRGQQAAVIRR